MYKCNSLWVIRANYPIYKSKGKKPFLRSCKFETLQSTKQSQLLTGLGMSEVLPVSKVLHAIEEWMEDTLFHHTVSVRQKCPFRSYSGPYSEQCRCSNVAKQLTVNFILFFLYSCLVYFSFEKYLITF